jgi:Flp pilus assembly protein TadB
MTSARPVVAGILALVAVLLLGGASGRLPARVPTPLDGDRGRRRSGPGRIVAALVAALLFGVVAAAIGPFLTAGAVGAALAAQRLRSRAAVAARRRALEARMPDAVELLVLCVHAGCSPTQAVIAVAARAPPVLRPAFGAVELALHRGLTLAAALGSLSAAGGVLGRDLAAAIAAADRDGLPLAPVLDRLIADARAARRRLGEAEARRLPVRLTFPLVACTLPAFVLLAIAPALLGALSTLRANAP